MRNARTTQPTLEERMENDPALAAEIAALRFQSDYQHKWQREHSFVYRHFFWFLWAGIIMMMAPVFALIALGGVMSFGSPSGAPLLLTLLGIGYAGFLLTLFTFVRSVSKNWYSAWIATIIAFVITVVIAGLFVAGSSAILFAIV